MGEGVVGRARDRENTERKEDRRSLEKGGISPD